MGARMKRPHDAHLTADELDALLQGPPDEGLQAHLFACSDCRSTAEADRNAVTAIRSLAPFQPAAGLADRVMAQVTIQPVALDRFILRLPLWVRRDRRSLIRAASMAGAVVVGMAASAVWSLMYRDLLSLWGSRVVSLFEGRLWNGTQALAASIAAQPWYGVIRDTLDSPGRLGMTVTILLLGYVSGLMALRRLVALPSRPVPHANW